MRLIVADANEIFSFFNEKSKARELSLSQELEPHSPNFSLKEIVEYFALALKLNCPIWSEDKRLKKQSKVKIFSTSDLIKEIGLK